MSEILRIMPNSFAGFSREDAERELARIEAERLRQEAERAAAEKKRLEELARNNAGKGSVVPFSGVVLDNIEFGPSSDEGLNQPDAVRFAEQFGILQSAGEAVYARTVVGDAASRDAQRTRTGAFYVIENDKVCVAFDDIADPVKNVVLRHINEGYDDNKRGINFSIPRSLLASILERAKDTKRFLSVPNNGMIGVRVDDDVGIQQYANDPYFVAVLGKEMAAVNAELIRRSNRVVGMMNLLVPQQVVKSWDDDYDRGIVRLVEVSNVSQSAQICANDLFDKRGRARGVRYNLPKQGDSQ